MNGPGLYRNRSTFLINISLRFQGHATWLAANNLPLAFQISDNYISGQRLAFCHTAGYFQVNVACKYRFCIQQYSVICSVYVIARRILFPGVSPFTHRCNMDVFNIILCLQIRIAGYYSSSALLRDAASQSLHGQRGILCVVQNRPIQINISACRIGIFHSNASVLLADKTDTYRIIRFQRKGIGLC